MNDNATTLKGIPFNLEKHVNYADDSVVSKTLLKKISEILHFLRLIQARDLVSTQPLLMRLFISWTERLRLQSVKRLLLLIQGKC